MVTDTSADTPHAADTQAPAVDTPSDQAARALVNQGDTVRASWPFSLDNLRVNLSHCSPEGRELLLWAFQWCIDPEHPLRLDELGQRVGYNQNTLYKVYSGKYLHPNSKQRLDVPANLVKELRSFRRNELSRAKLGRKKFVMTPTAKKIFTACDLARESQSPVFIEGASHIGKTEAFKQYCIENNHGKSRLIELEAVSGLGGLIRGVALVLGISPNGNNQDLTERIKRAITPDMVLIFDEIHLLANTYRKEAFFACMEWIRRLYDFKQFGLVMSFTPLGFAKAERERKRELEQIFRRGVHRYNLGDRPTVKDVTAVLESWDLDFPKRNEEVEVAIGSSHFTDTPHKILEQLSGEQGLKAIVERLRYAAKFAADTEAKLEWEHFVRAHLIIAKNAATPEHGWNN
jgi:DNA transposition AAA+ family ATPase